MRMRPTEHGFGTVSSYLHSVEHPATAWIAPISGIGKTWQPLSIGFTTLQLTARHVVMNLCIETCVGDPVGEVRIPYDVAVSLSFVRSPSLVDTAICCQHCSKPPFLKLVPRFLLRIVR